MFAKWPCPLLQIVLGSVPVTWLCRTGGPQGVWTRKLKGERVSDDLGLDDSWQPSSAHMAIARLHSKGFIKFVATTNVDDLHGKSGVPEDSLAWIARQQLCGRVWDMSPALQAKLCNTKCHWTLWASYWSASELERKRFFGFGSPQIKPRVIVVPYKTFPSFWYTMVYIPQFWTNPEMVSSFPSKVLPVWRTLARYYRQFWEHLWARPIYGRSAWCRLGSLFDSRPKKNMMLQRLSALRDIRRLRLGILRFVHLLIHMLFGFTSHVPKLRILQNLAEPNMPCHTPSSNMRFISVYILCNFWPCIKSCFASFDTMSHAFAARKADLVLVLGSSLSVPTACDLPEECLEPREGKQETCHWCLTHPRKSIWQGKSCFCCLLRMKMNILGTRYSNSFKYIQIYFKCSIFWKDINHRRKFRSQTSDSWTVAATDRQWWEESEKRKSQKRKSQRRESQ